MIEIILKKGIKIFLKTRKTKSSNMVANYTKISQKMKKMLGAYRKKYKI